jgi:hypothetical protein
VSHSKKSLVCNKFGIASALAYAIESSKMQLNSPLRNMIADFFHSLELLIKETMQKIKTP